MTIRLLDKPLFVSACLTLALAPLGCADEDPGAPGAGGTDETSETGTSGDGDGDPSTTGDGDGDPTTTGDGDGDPATGDGDGDPTTTGDGDGDPTGDGDGDPTGDGDGDPDPYACITEPWVNGGPPALDYSGTNIELGSHCVGTNHQDITDIERVVFVGDSVTVGSPPTPTEDFYRVVLADELAMKFDLVAPNFLWQTADPINGTTIIQEDGGFASCSEWGARTDDLPAQSSDCFSGDDFNKRTLVVTTMGGNDIAAIAKDSIEGVAEDALWDDVEQMLDFQRNFVHDLVDDPNTFPNGIFIVFANVYEFTDGTADLLSCPAAGLAGFDQNPDDPALLIEMMTYINSEYALLAAETGTDMVLMFEGFCGHGFQADNPNGDCYRGPDNATWFDLTCIHPDPVGHNELADLFYQVIDE